MKVLPGNQYGILDIFYNFLSNKKKQAFLSAESKLISLKDIEKSNMVNNYNFSLSYVSTQAKDEEDIYKLLASNSIYLYLNNTDLNVQFPVEKFEEVTIVEKTVPYPIIINDTKYYDNYIESYESENKFFIIGNGIHINITN